MEKFIRPARAQQVDGVVGIEAVEAVLHAIRHGKGVPLQGRVLYDWIAMIVDASNANGGKLVELRANVL